MSNNGNSIAVDMDRLRLDNVGGPELDKQIADALGEIVSAFEREQAEGGRDKSSASLTVKVGFKLDPETGHVGVTSSATYTLPKRRSVRTFAIMRAGGFYIDDAHRRQVPMFGSASELDEQNVHRFGGKE